MKLSNKVSRIALAVIIIISLSVSFIFMAVKQGYHEDELLTYNLANSSKQLGVDGDWNSPEDFNEYLTAGEHRFDYKNVYDNQVVDASHPPLYYAVVHTVCSFFPDVFSRWLAFAINVVMMTGALILLYKIGKRVTGVNLYALIGVGGYAFSIACITTTIYLRMYASLTFWVLAFLYLSLRMYDRKNEVKIYECVLLLVTVLCGVLTQYFFIFCAGLIGLVMLIFKIKDKHIKSLLFYVGAAIIGAGLALAIYPYIITNVLGGNRGLGSLKMEIDVITIVTYLVYKVFCYVQILAKEMFLGQLWLLILCSVCVIASFVYFRFIKKKKLPRKAWFIIVPGVAYFIFIALVSPFNSDRYVMASLPLLSLMFTFAFIRIVNLIKNTKLHPLMPAAMVLASALAFVFVTPYYVYGKTNLYKPQTDNCVFVGTAMMEWNKCIDKFMNYDSTMIAKTTEMSKTLYDELDDFAQSRGVITNGKVGKIAQSFMSNGDVERTESDSLDKMVSDEKLRGLDEVTVYISRLADEDYVIDKLTKGTELKKYELIQKDRQFDEFYNWYDYFVETESYCNVYRFYK
ncbi:MAG: hypothetical protein IIZ23_01765 [Ruminococcus sp.]|nr:hypothetical protein [Ruminococcus sp.]